MAAASTLPQWPVDQRVASIAARAPPADDALAAASRVARPDIWLKARAEARRESSYLEYLHSGWSSVLADGSVVKAPRGQPVRSMVGKATVTVQGGNKAAEGANSPKVPVSVPRGAQPRPGVHAPVATRARAQEQGSPSPVDVDDCTQFPAYQLRIGRFEFAAKVLQPFGLEISGFANPCEHPGLDDYVHDALLELENRAVFFDLVDSWGLVVCRRSTTSHPGYRRVRGRSSRGRLSQAEYYHHDGCSLPTNPRVVEIRCPNGKLVRSVPTAIARFPGAVRAMLEVLPASLLATSPELVDARARVCELASGTRKRALEVQAQAIRAIRRDFDAESARSLLREVDSEAGAFVEPWQLGESRFIANENSVATCQHRRAHQQAHVVGDCRGQLVKRWPAEELEADEGSDLAECVRGGHCGHDGGVPDTN